MLRSRKDEGGRRGAVRQAFSQLDSTTMRIQIVETLSVDGSDFRPCPIGPSARGTP